MQINDFDIQRVGGAPKSHGKLLVSMRYDPGLRFTLRTSSTNQPLMQTVICLNAPVTAHNGLVSEICKAAKLFLEKELAVKVDR